MRRLALLLLLVPTACQRAAPSQPEAFAFAKAAISLPADTAALPATPAGELVTNTCTACHSVAMITAQPSLPAEKWQATVAKMHDVYKAPIAPADQPKIVAALMELQAARKP